MNTTYNTRLDAARDEHDWICSACGEAVVAGPPPPGWLITRVRGSDKSSVIAVACSPACHERHAARLDEYARQVTDDTSGGLVWQRVPKAYRRALGKIREAQQEATP